MLRVRFTMRIGWSWNREIIRRQFEGDMEEFDEPEEDLPAAGGGLGHKPMFK